MATLFKATSATFGDEIWITNGKAGGTHLLADINPTGDSIGIFFEGFAETANGAVFFADDGVHGSELWTTDGTTAGTHMVIDAVPGSGSGAGGNFIEFQGKVLYVAGDPVHGGEVWTTDGTAGGTHLLADIYPGGPLNSGGFSDPCVAGNNVFFRGLSATGYELWVTDGTTGGTRLVKDIYQGSGAAGPLGSFPQGMTALGNKVIFQADSPNGGNEVWVSDGTKAGTFLLKDINPGGNTSGAGGFIAVGNQVFFSATSSGFDNAKLWVTDGTSAGTHLVKDISGGATQDIGVLDAAVLGARIVFTANDGVHGRELWVSDGSAAGTKLVKDLVPGSDSADIQNYIVVGAKAYFSVGTPSGNHLWVTDGTASGTHLVKAVDEGGGFDARPFGTLDGKLLFAAETFDPVTFEHGVELWVSDGTTAGTRLLQDVNPGAAGSYPEAFFDIGPLPGHAPTAIGLSKSSVVENSANGHLVGLLTATDADNGDQFSYVLLDDAAGALRIAGNRLEVADSLALDFEQASSVSVKVQVTDAALHTFVT